MWNRAQNGHWKSENSIIVIGASGFPIIGSLSADISSGIFGWFVGNCFSRIFNYNSAIAFSNSIWDTCSEFKFETNDPVKNAAIPVIMIIAMINELNVDFLITFSFFCNLSQNNLHP